MSFFKKIRIARAGLGEILRCPCPPLRGGGPLGVAQNDRGEGNDRGGGLDTARDFGYTAFNTGEQ